MGFLFQKKGCDLMTKILVIPSKKESLQDLIKSKGDGFILGIKGFTIFNHNLFEIEELKEIVSKLKKYNKEVFIALNKLIYNQDIPLLKEYLLILEEIKVTGIIYQDISIVNLKEELKLKTPLVWHQLHLVTNYKSCNYWYQKGIEYGYLANNINLDDIFKIKKQSKMKLLMDGYGYVPIFYSSRKLLTNYFVYLNKKKEQELYYLTKEGKFYPIYEDNFGTYILSPHILSVITELPSLINRQLDYLVLNGLYIDDSSFAKIIDYFSQAFNNLDLTEALNKKIALISPHPLSLNFLHQQTIYRVKKHD